MPLRDPPHTPAQARRTAGRGEDTRWANRVRGVAVVSVLIAHYFGVFWLSRPAAAGIVNAPPLNEAVGTPFYVHWLWAVPYWNWGAFGVAAFFLVSGFVIPFSFDSYRWRGFLVGRAFRIYPLYMAGFAISVVSLAVSSRYWHRPFPYETKEVVAGFFPGTRDVLGYRGIDGIIWTLEVEVRFYLVVAVLSAWLRSVRRRAFAAPVVLTVVAVAGGKALEHQVVTGAATYVVSTVAFVAQYIVYMFIGVAVYYRYRGRLDSGALWAVAACLYGCFYVASTSTAVKLPSDHLSTYAVTAAAFVGVALRPRLLPGGRLLDTLADISFPLYACHALFGYSLLRVLAGRGVPPTVALLVALAIALAMSVVLHRLIEAPAHRLGRACARRFSGQRPTGARGPDQLRALDAAPQPQR